MARSRITDPFNVSKFHLLDVSISLPPVLIPTFGFSSITLPEMTVGWKKVKEGNYEFPRYAAVESAEVSPMTLEQGVTLINSDFWDWIRKGIRGQVPAKNLLLIQFTNINPVATKTQVQSAVTSTSSISAIPGMSLGGLGLYETGVRLPGKAWMLYRCRPTRYKPGSDFNAMSGEISLASLSLQPEEFEEFSLGI